jgi:hypothetical protein
MCDAMDEGLAVRHVWSGWLAEERVNFYEKDVLFESRALTTLLSNKHLCSAVKVVQ